MELLRGEERCGIVERRGEERGEMWIVERRDVELLTGEERCGIVERRGEMWDC